MARENARRYRNEGGDRAGLRPLPLYDLHRPLRPFNPSWCELAVTVVAVMCVAPAFVVGFLLLLEAALPSTNRCASARAAIECTAKAGDTTQTP